MTRHRIHFYLTDCAVDHDLGEAQPNYAQAQSFLKRAGLVTASALLGRGSIAEGLAATANWSSRSAQHASLLQAPGAPLGLLVNGVDNPLAIDRDKTRFTWRHEADGRGERQTAYQILVSSSRANLDAAKGDFWDSGKVASDRSAAVEYVGKALVPAARLWWKLRVWNKSGKPGPYSAPAHFDTGLNPGGMDRASASGTEPRTRTTSRISVGLFPGGAQAPFGQGLRHRRQRLHRLAERRVAGPRTGALGPISLRPIQRL